jgi:sugar phosphate isomerase/epimerase
MKKTLLSILTLLIAIVYVYGQKAPTGNPNDFKVKTCLHSVGYSGAWRGQLGAKRPHVSLIDYDDAARQKLRARIRELGLELVCIAGYNDFTAGVDKSSIPNVEIQAVYIGELARLARDLGTNMVRVFTGYDRSDLPYASQYAMVVEGLKMAGKIAVHHDAMKWLLDEVNMPNVMAAFDCWSPTMEGLSSEEIKKAIYTMKPYILHTTCADYEKLPRFRYESGQVNYVPILPENRLVPIGEGYLDYKTFINTLKEIGYQGYIAFEMCAELKGGGSIENLDKTAKAFLEYVKQFE